MKEVHTMYERNKAHLIDLLDDLFGKKLSEEEFQFHIQVLGELEACMEADGRLTWEQMIEIEEEWGAKRAA